MDFIACCYGTTYTAGTFDPELLEQQNAAPAPAPVPEVNLAALMAENEALRAELTARREAQQPSYTPQASGSLRVQDPQAVYRRDAPGCGLDRGRELAKRGGAAMDAQQVRAGLRRLRAL